MRGHIIGALSELSKALPEIEVINILLSVVDATPEQTKQILKILGYKIGDEE